MTKSKFESWYINKQTWLKQRASYLTWYYKVDYNEGQELIANTVWALLEVLDTIKIETIDAYCSAWMKNIMLSRVVNPLKKSCCMDNFDFCQTEYEEYNLENDENAEKMINIVKERAETPNELLILTTIMEGKTLSSTGLSNYNINRATRKLKGLKMIDYRTKEQKQRKKVEKEKTYKGIVRIKDGVIDRVYESAKVVETDGFNRTSISKVCNGKLNTHFHRGYEWYWSGSVPKEVLNKN